MRRKGILFFVVVGAGSLLVAAYFMYRGSQRSIVVCGTYADDAPCFRYVCQTGAAEGGFGKAFCSDGSKAVIEGEVVRK